MKGVMVAVVAAGTLAAIVACSSSVTSQSINPTRTVTATVTHPTAPDPTATAPTHTSVPPTSAHPMQPTATVTTTPPHTTPTSQDGSSAAAIKAVIYGCDGQAVGQPATFILACGDAGTALQSLTWTGWGAPAATATGRLRQNTCVPNCASGGSVSYPAAVTVTGLVGGRYTSMHISAPSAPTPSSYFKLTLNGPVSSR